MTLDTNKAGRHKQLMMEVGESIHFVAESGRQLTLTIPGGAQTGRTILVVTTKHGTATTPFTITPPLSGAAG